MAKCYQVFVSSTFADLREERQKISETLSELNCLAAGMDLAPVAEEEKWTDIKRVIEGSDCYLLIIGQRYGSVNSEAISYTEKEYEFACQTGLKVIALIQDSPDRISISRSDSQLEFQEKLEAFKGKLSKNRLVRLWNKEHELSGLVAAGIKRAIELSSAVGDDARRLPNFELALGQSIKALHRLARFELEPAIQHKMRELGEQKEFLSESEHAELMSLIKFSEQRTIERLEAEVALKGLSEFVPELVEAS